MHCRSHIQSLDIFHLYVVAYTTVALSIFTKATDVYVFDSFLCLMVQSPKRITVVQGPGHMYSCL